MAEIKMIQLLRWIGLIIFIFSTTCPLYGKTLIDIVEEKPPYPGYLYRPNDNASHPGILFLHGSEGGNGDFNPNALGNTGENAGTPSLAREYARRGYVTYALCWFDCKHHENYDAYPPDEIKEIDIYKATYEAFLWLKNSDYVQDKKVAIWGMSMGAEQALLLASLVGKYKESMKLIEPDAILADSPSDIVSPAFTKERGDALRRGEKYVNSSWMFNNKKIKTRTPIDIQYYNGPVLITYFANDPVWGVHSNPENLVNKYLKNNIPHTFIHFCDENDVLKAWKTARDNMDKNIVINFTKEKGHSTPGEPKSFSLKNEVTKEFLKTHLDN
jgi:hypothetical protein